MFSQFMHCLLFPFLLQLTVFLQGIQVGFFCDGEESQATYYFIRLLLNVMIIVDMHMSFLFVTTHFVTFTCYLSISSHLLRQLRVYPWLTLVLEDEHLVPLAIMEDIRTILAQVISKFH